MTQRVHFDGAGVRLVGDRTPPPDGVTPAGTVLLLHGGGQTRHSWRRTAARLPREGWTTLTLDLRGHGESGWAEDQDYSLDAFTADLAAVIAALPAAPVLVGASLGGLISLALAGERPAPTARALVLVDVVARLEPSGVDRIHEFLTSRPDGFASLEEAGRAIQAYAGQRDRPLNPEGLRKNLRQGDDGRWHWHWDPAFVFGPSTPSGLEENERLHRAAGAIDVPALLVRGVRSDVVSREGIDELLEVLPHAEVVDVTSAGHMVAGDDNDVFTRQLGSFLADLGTGPTKGRPR